MNRKERRRIALELYKNKWGASDYRAFVSTSDRENHVYLIHKNASVKNVLGRISPYYSGFNSGFVEMVAIGSFLSRIQSKDVKITIYESNDTFQSFESLDEVKEYMLIQKIAGV